MQLTQSSAIDSKKLREYGLIMAGMLSVIFGLALPFAFGKQLPIWPFAAALVFASTALLKPILLSGVYTIWMKFGHFAGAINSKILLNLIYVFLFCFSVNRNRLTMCEYYKSHMSLICNFFFSTV